MRKLVKKIFEPNKYFGTLIVFVGFGLLVYVFLHELTNEPIAYVSYLLSTYALILFCVWFWKMCKNIKVFIENKSKLYRKYDENRTLIEKMTISFSFVIHLFYGFFKLIMGIIYKSEWFITFAVYYLLLFFMKSSLILSVKRDDFGLNVKKEYEKLKHTGIVLLFLNIVLIGMIILTIHQDRVIRYPGYLVYAVAFYDFYLTIGAFINVFKYRKKNSPVLVANRCINLTVAMISIISLEVSMIYQFGNNDSDFKLLVISWTGFVVCFINSFMAIYMIWRARKKLKG